MSPYLPMWSSDDSSLRQGIPCILNSACETVTATQHTANNIWEGNCLQVSNIRRTLAGYKIVNHSDVVGAAPTGDAPTTSEWFILELAPGFFGLGKDNCKTRQETIKLGIWWVLY